MGFDIPNIPPQMQEMVVCSILASIHYDVPANVLLAIADKEGGKPGQWVKNKNNTYDVGVMQFNTSYIKTLTAQYGIRAEHIATPGCYAYELAAWRIHGHLVNDSGDLWTRAANYHSKTPYYNSIYRADLVKKAQKWAAWLEKSYTGDIHVISTSVTKPSAVIKTLSAKIPG